MFRNEDGTLRIPRWNCTLSGTPLAPELDSMDPEAGLPQILTPWSDNETKLMNRIFPNPDSLCLNFGRTGVFQWNYPNSSTLIQTTEWPQKVAGDTPRRCDMGGITHTRVDPQPHMPYVIFRNMSPHFDSYANSGIPKIKGTEFLSTPLGRPTEMPTPSPPTTPAAHRCGNVYGTQDRRPTDSDHSQNAQNRKKTSFPPQPLHHPQTDQPERGLTSMTETTIWPYS